MQHPLIRCLSAATLATALLAQTPRTADGQPDLSGIWENGTLTPLERPRALGDKAFYTPQEAADLERRQLAEINTDRRDGPAETDVNRSYNEAWRERGKLLLRTSLIIDPPDGRIPALTPAGEKRENLRREQRRARGPADSWEDLNLAERCITRGAPKIAGGYNNNFQIIQTRGFVTILQEMIHEARIIPLDARPHISPAIQQWMGDSRGHWEGDTLVVDTTNYTGKIVTNSFNCCGAARERLHITERFRRIDENHIDYQYTVDDPATYTRPWTVSVPLTKTAGPLFEYACHEGNYAMGDILRGAREQERIAAESSRRQ